ncbi:tetratricopeptide repeat protein [Lactobacillus delbrueckii subsp. bulgaricus]|nr:tetratricopeptide repeat protein [Lactobacillus delbrueckii subsp. bulgaricus]
MVAAGLERLAQLRIGLGQPKEAEDIYDEAESILSEALGNNSPSLAGILNDKALLLQQLNRAKEAEQLFSRALALVRRGAGTETPTLAAVLYNLANLYDATGRSSEAVGVRKQAEAIFSKICKGKCANLIPAAQLPVWQEI